MTKITSWIKASRLRTLPLALSSILMGSFPAIKIGVYSWSVILLAILTTILLQVLSNLANDYGDGIKGTDNDNRVGPRRTIQSGEISPGEMKIGIVIITLLSLIVGIWLIIESLGFNQSSLLFLILGLGAIAAALKYTIGKNAYGYSGFGDVFVFIFFGIIAVSGTYFLVSKDLNWTILLPAASMGFFSTGVLNLNNMRDMKNDAASGKHTFALVLGFKRAKVYHTLIIAIALISLLIYSLINYYGPLQFLFLITYPLIISDLIRIINTVDKFRLDPFLKKLALSTLITTLVFGLGLLIT
jgi:1,4-dihydroxy-2-naphthoate polyprenyltransferase